MLSETTSIGYRLHISTQRCLAVLTAKGKYALKALIYLSTLEPGEKAQGVAISKAGVVFTKKGPGGGYMLARAASDIKIGHSSARSTGLSRPSLAPAVRPTSR